MLDVAVGALVELARVALAEQFGEAGDDSDRFLQVVRGDVGEALELPVLHGEAVVGGEEQLLGFLAGVDVDECASHGGGRVLVGLDGSADLAPAVSGGTESETSLDVDQARCADGGFERLGDAGAIVGVQEGQERPKAGLLVVGWDREQFVEPVGPCLRVLVDVGPGPEAVGGGGRIDRCGRREFGGLAGCAGDGAGEGAEGGGDVDLPHRPLDGASLDGLLPGLE